MAYPYDDVVLVETQDPGDPSHFHFGTGFVIGPHTILTASHMLWDSEDQTEADHVWLYPNYNQNGVPNPAGSGSPLNTGLSWHNYIVGDSNGNISQSDSQSDFAVIDTSYTFNSWFGVILNYSGGTVHATGYPDTSAGHQIDTTGTVHADSNYSLLDYGTLTTHPGNSGGPLWLTGLDNNIYAVGLVSTGSWATQLTTADWTTIQNWINSDSSLWGGSPPGPPPLPPPPPGPPPPAAPPAAPDFNGDHKFDALWRSSSTGALAEWQMNGAAINVTSFVTSNGALAAPGASWNIVGVGDLNGDGRSDLLWQGADGSLVDWTMNGTTISTNGFVTSNGSQVAPDSTWSVVGVGDFNGDGKAELLWRRSNGDLRDWTMNGSTVTFTSSVTSNNSALTPDLSWNVAAIGDFNGDHRQDILWRSTSGEVAAWMMNGSTLSSSGDVTSGGVAIRPDSNWSLIESGDFNGDGKTDLVWRNTITGSVAIWLMNGTSIISAATPTFNGAAVSPDPTWHIVEVGDFNGDGKSDILWRSSTGDLADWQMNGTAISQTLTPTFNGSKVAPDGTWNPLA